MAMGGKGLGFYIVGRGTEETEASRVGEGVEFIGAFSIPSLGRNMGLNHR